MSCLKDNKNKRVIGGILPLDETNQQTLQPLVYSRCLENNNKKYTFHIYDNYGDGVCCDWGNGSFTVEWNNQQVLNDNGFQSNKVICLPQSDNLIPLLVEIDNFRQNMFISLSDINNNNMMKENGYGNEGAHELFSQCVPRDDCFTFRMMNPIGADVSLSITQNNTIIYQEVGNNNKQTVEIGDCSCPKNHTLFELVITTDYHPEDFSWELV